MSIIIGLICAVLALLFYLRMKKVSRMEMLTQNMDGPKNYPLIGAALELGNKVDELIGNIMRIVVRHKNIMKLWLGPDLYIGLLSPENIGEILTNDRFIDKPPFYCYMEEVMGDGVLVSKGKKWRNRRKMVNHSFSFKLIKNYLFTFNSKCRIFVENLKKEVGKPSFDMDYYSNLCTFDITIETIAGVRMDMLFPRNENIKLVNAIHETEKLVMYRILSPWLYPGIIFNISSAGRKQKRFKDYFVTSMKKIIEYRRKIRRQEKEGANDNNVADEELFHENKNQVLLDALLCSELTDEEIIDEMCTLAVAGQTTTSTTVSLALYALMKNQDVQEKVINEMNEVFNGSDRDATMADLRNLSYLEQVIKETLRLWPMVPLIGRSIQEDIRLKSGYTLPAGSNVLICFYALHRDPDVFPDPEKFDPERFNRENSGNRNVYAFCPFSAGSRNCLGHKFAMLEVKVMLLHVLRNFKILPPTDHSPDILMSLEIVLRSKTGVHMRIENR